MLPSKKSSVKEDIFKIELKFSTIQICFTTTQRLNYTPIPDLKKEKFVFINFCVVDANFHLKKTCRT